MTSLHARNALSASLELPFASFPPSESLELSEMGGKSSQVSPRSIPVVFQNYYKCLLPLLRFQNLLSSQMGSKGSPVFP